MSSICRPNAKFNNDQRRDEKALGLTTRTTTPVAPGDPFPGPEINTHNAHTLCLKKTSHFVFRCNFNKYRPIFKILSLVHCVENLQ